MSCLRSFRSNSQSRAAAAPLSEQQCPTWEVEAHTGRLWVLSERLEESGGAVRGQLSWFHALISQRKWWIQGGRVGRRCVPAQVRVPMCVAHAGVCTPLCV